MIKKILRNYYTILFFRSFSFSMILSTYVVFLQSKGMNLFQVSFLSAIYMISIFLFEIPTGAISDLWGRKFSFLLSCLFTSLSMAIYFIANNFYIFLIAEVISAIGLTCYSGALEAWFVDQLDDYGDKEERSKYFAQAGIYMRTAMIMGGLIGGYIASFRITYPYLIASICMMITFVLSFFL